MTVRTVPEVSYRECNHCGARSDRNPERFTDTRSEVTVESIVARDIFGNGAGRTDTYDLCGPCTSVHDAWLTGTARSLTHLRRAFFSQQADLTRFVAWVAAKHGETAPPEPSTDSARGGTVMGWNLTYIVPAGVAVNVTDFKGQDQ